MCSGLLLDDSYLSEYGGLKSEFPRCWYFQKKGHSSEVVILKEKPYNKKLVFEILRAVHF